MRGMHQCDWLVFGCLHGLADKWAERGGGQRDSVVKVPEALVTGGRVRPDRHLPFAIPKSRLNSLDKAGTICESELGLGHRKCRRINLTESVADPTDFHNSASSSSARPPEARGSYNSEQDT